MSSLENNIDLGLESVEDTDTTLLPDCDNTFLRQSANQKLAKQGPANHSPSALEKLRLHHCSPDRGRG